MSDKQETIADTIAEMRDLAEHRDWNNHTRQSNRERVSDIADRLEAAHKRELSKNASKNGADFGQFDAAKLREAVKLAMSVLCRNKADAPYRAWCEYDNAIDKCKAALAAPPRNCYLFDTKDKAREAFQKLRGHCVWADVSLWDNRDEIEAFVDWLFATKKGESNEQK